MYRYIRTALFAASLLGLAVAAFTYVRYAQGSPVIRLTLPPTPEQVESAREAQIQAQQRANEAYAERLRRDAFARMDGGDYENALVRLDQAATYDPDQDQRRAEVRAARREIAENLGWDDAADGGSGAARPVPPRGAGP